MSWQVFLLIAILGESFGRVFQRVLMKEDRADPAAFGVVFQFLAGLILTVYVLFVGVKIPNLMPILPNLILEAIFYGMLSVLSFKALKATEASIFTILFGTRVLWIVLGAVILLHESFGLRQTLGLALILLSVVLVSLKKQKLQFKKGEVYSLLAGISLAFGAINDAFILKHFDVTTYSAFGFFGPGIFIWIISPSSTKNIFKIVKSKAILRIGILSLLFGIAFTMYNNAYRAGHNAAQIGSVFQVSSVLTVLLAIVLLGERHNLRIKLLASIIGFVGVILVS